MDHLPLPAGRPLESRRLRGNAKPAAVVRRIEHGPDLTAQLDAAIAALPPEVAEDEQNDARLVLKIQASTRLQDGPLSRLQLTSLGEGEDWTYFVLSSRESRENLLGVLRDYTDLPDDAIVDLDWAHPKTWAQFVDNIEGIEVYGPDDRRDASLNDLTFENGVEIVDCLLWPAAAQDVSTRRVNDLTAIINDHAQSEPRVRVTASDTRPDRTLVRVVTTPELLVTLLDHVDVERVRRPLRALITTAEIAQARVPDDVPDAAETAIGVIDGVVNLANPLTGPYVIASENFPPAHTFSGADTHGTAVASVAIWGDLDTLVAGGRMPTPHPIVSARVLDLAPSNSYEVVGLAHLTIEQAIRWLVAEHKVRVINLSITWPHAATAPLRDELTFTVDSLASELKVVIVVSTGNRGDIGTSHWHDDYPGYLNDLDARIAAPGDAALAVTVGSHARRDVPATRNPEELTAIAAKNQPSPFTRVGPTRGVGQHGTMKPEFSHHGGNWVWNHAFRQLMPREPGTSAVVAIPLQGPRVVGSANGTSFAAPAVAHEVARIAERYPNAGPNLLRALTALSARPLDQGAGVNSRYTSGYGLPDAANVLESTTHRVILIFEGDGPTNSVLVHRLPIPEAFAEGVRQRIFRIALAFDPPVRRSRREYVAGSMSVELVRGLSIEEVAATYSRQPSRAAAEADPSLTRLSLPAGEYRPRLEPGITVVESNTLIRREFPNGLWDADHGDYFLVVTHNQSAWTPAQRRAYAEQSYALAVEIGEQTASTLDLYAAIRAQLRGRGRIR